MDEVPLGEGELVDAGWEDLLWNAKGAEHGLLPEVRAAHVAGESVDEDQDENALDRTVDNAKGQGLGMVFIPGLDVEREEGCNEASVGFLLENSLIEGSSG